MNPEMPVMVYQRSSHIAPLSLAFIELPAFLSVLKVDLLLGNGYWKIDFLLLTSFFFLLLYSTIEFCPHH